MPAIRKLFPAEADLLRAHLKRLEPDARRRRFGVPTGDYAIDRSIDRTDWFDSLHLGYFVGATLRGSAALAWTPWRWPGGAEFALAIEAPFRNRSVGTELLRRAATVARNRGIGRLTLLCAYDNRPMLRIAAKFDAELTIERGGEVEATLPLERASQVSLLDEAMDDGSAWIGQWLEQVRLPVALPIFLPPKAG
jgi:GNAT superfamily N-acetyltransferase